MQYPKKNSSNQNRLFHFVNSAPKLRNDEKYSKKTVHAIAICSFVCGFWSNRTVLYFPLSVCPFVRHRRDTCYLPIAHLPSVTIAPIILVKVVTPVFLLRNGIVYSVCCNYITFHLWVMRKARTTVADLQHKIMFSEALFKTSLQVKCS